MQHEKQMSITERPDSMTLVLDAGSKLALELGSRFNQEKLLVKGFGSRLYKMCRFKVSIAKVVVECNRLG